MITLTKTINKLPKNPLLKTNKGEHRFEMNIKTRTGNPQQTTPQAPCFPHFFPPPPNQKKEATELALGSDRRLPGSPAPFAPRPWSRRCGRGSRAWRGGWGEGPAASCRAASCWWPPGRLGIDSGRFGGSLAGGGFCFGGRWEGPPLFSFFWVVRLGVAWNKESTKGFFCSFRVFRLGSEKESTKRVCMLKKGETLMDGLIFLAGWALQNCFVSL